MDRLKDSELLSTTDAQVWAQQFNLVLASRYPGGPVDEGWLIGWFANAIETGRNAGLRQSLSQEAVREEALEEESPSIARQILSMIALRNAPVLVLAKYKISDQQWAKQLEQEMDGLK